MLEHFPKPYTKAELKMFKIDDSKLSETTDEDASSSEDEPVTEPRDGRRRDSVAKSVSCLPEGAKEGVRLPMIPIKSGSLIMKAEEMNPVVRPAERPTEDGPEEKKVVRRRRRMKAKKLVLNVSMTKYHVVRYVARTLFKMRLSNARYEQDPDDPSQEWDIFWTDGQVQVEKLYRMKPYQRINHFPGMYALARKDHLARNLHRMQKVLPDEYNFFPTTWLLPAEYGDFKKQFTETSKRKKAGRKTFIAKPEASCQGKGIFLTRNLEDFEPQGHYVVQRYLHKPLLIDNLKFDLRVYILLCGVDPLRVYFYKEGLCRLATAEYKPPREKNLDNLFMHLTNYAINKDAPNFIANTGSDKDDCGHKRSLTFAFSYIEKLGHDVEKLKHEIKFTVLKTLAMVQPMLAHTYRSC